MQVSSLKLSVTRFTLSRSFFQTPATALFAARACDGSKIDFPAVRPRPGFRGISLENHSRPPVPGGIDSRAVESSRNLIVARRTIARSRTAVRGWKKAEISRTGAALDSHVNAIQPHALTQKVNVGGLRIETKQCWLRGADTIRAATRLINQYRRRIVGRRY